MPPAALHFDFDVLFYPEEGQVVAHCLQTDTAAFAKTVTGARRALQTALELEILAALEDGDLARVFASPAPEVLWKKIETSVRTQYRRLSLMINQHPYKARLKSHVMSGV